MGSKTSRCCYDTVVQDDEETKEPDKLELICEAKEDFQQANRYFRESNIDKAKAKYAAAISKLIQCEDPTSGRQQALALTNLGALHFAEGRYEQAKALLIQADKLHKQYSHHPTSQSSEQPSQPSEPSPEASLCSLSIALKKDISFRRVPLAEQAFAAELKEHGNIDSITADLMNNLGACYEVSGDLQQARHFHEESLKIRKVVFGARSLKSAESMQNLATVLDSLGRTEEAGQLLTTALSIEEEAHGLESIECSVTLNNLGVLSAHLHRLPLAQSLLQRCYGIRLRVYGKHHHLTICAKRNLDHVTSCMHKEQREQQREQRELQREHRGRGRGTGANIV